MSTNINGYQGQIRASDQSNGYFQAEANIISLITNACNNQYNGFVQRIGIEAPEGTFITINGESIQIGKTGLYEVNNAYITSLTFVENSTKEAVVDYII